MVILSKIWKVVFSQKIEKFFQNPRHIEVQILSGKNRTIHLHERINWWRCLQCGVYTFCTPGVQPWFVRLHCLLSHTVGCNWKVKSLQLGGGKGKKEKKEEGRERVHHTISRAKLHTKPAHYVGVRLRDHLSVPIRVVFTATWTKRIQSLKKRTSFIVCLLKIR